MPFPQAPLCLRACFGLNFSMLCANEVSLFEKRIGTIYIITGSALPTKSLSQGSGDRGRDNGNLVSH